jgi:hypothetical protein
VAIALGLLVLGAPPTATAAPFEGRASAPTKDRTAAEARAEAVRKARQEALEVAVEQLEGPVDPRARQAILSSIDAWTGAYRIVEQSVAPDEIIVAIEVEIDVARLTKRLRPRADAEMSSGGLRLGNIRAHGCGEHHRAFAQELLDAKVFRRDGAGASTDLRVRCETLGRVEHTFLDVARIDIEYRIGGLRAEVLHATGFGRASEGALMSAFGRASGAFLQRFSAGSSGLAVLVRPPARAASVRHLERKLRDSVVGVDDVRLTAIRPDGTIELSIFGSIDARRLAEQLAQINLPDASVVVGRVDEQGYEVPVSLR